MDAEWFSIIAIPAALLLLVWGAIIIVKWLERVEEKDRKRN